MKTTIQIVTGALCLAASAHAQQALLLSAASYTGPSTPPGASATYGADFARGRVIVAIDNTLRFLGPTSSGWSMTSTIIAAPTSDVAGFASWIRGDGASVVVGCQSGHVFMYEAKSDFSMPIASWRNPTGMRATILSVQGNRILVGTPTTDGTPGGGYLLVRNGSAFDVEQSFVSSDNTWELGFSGGLSGDDVVLSGEGSASFWHAKAWRKSSGTWVSLGYLSPVGAGGNPIFGCASSVEDGVLAIGARDDANLGWQSGACFIFERTPSGWTQSAKIVLNEPPYNNQEMGGSVAVHGGRVWITAGGNMENGTGDRGRILVVGKTNGNWELEQVLRAPDSGFPTFWGYSPKFGPNGMMVTFGADSPTPFSEWRLRVDAFAPFQDCNENGDSDASDVLTGASSDVESSGVPDECECIADVSGDGIVQGADLGLILANWGPTFGHRLPADVNADDQVDGVDLGIVLQNWGHCSN